MIKPKLTLLQMQSKSMFGNTIELRQAALCKTPEGFNTVNMTAAFDKLIVAMINPKVFAKANIHQAIVATPAIGIDDAQRVGFTSDNRLQSTFRRIWNNLRINLITTFKQAKDNGFVASTAATFATHSAWTKIGFIGLQFTTQWRPLRTPLSHTHAHAKVNAIDTADGNTAQGCAFSGSQIQGKMLNNLTKFGFAEFRTIEIPVFMNHFKKLTCFKYMFVS